jgi:hypothetical protein
LSLAIVVLGNVVYRAYWHYELSKATMIDPVNGIDEALFTKIGGIEQWIGIRSQNRDNPNVRSISAASAVTPSEKACRRWGIMSTCRGGTAESRRGIACGTRNFKIKAMTARLSRWRAARA